MLPWDKSKAPPTLKELIRIFYKSKAPKSTPFIRSSIKEAYNNYNNTPTRIPTNKFSSEA